MTEKRFTGHMNEFLTWFEDNGEKMTHTQILDTLNDLNDENEQIKQTIKEAYENERTQLGRSVLRQLLEKIE